MTEFVSEIKTIPYSSDSIYKMLSDLSNLEKIKDRIPEDKIKDLSFDCDYCSFSVQPVGTLTLRIIEREENKTIKFTADNSPIEVFLWIQLKEAEPEITKMKMTVKADLNPFIKPMLAKPMEEGLEKLATALAALPYK
ncbi:MAG: SRPBCC family protein [Bacteroidales bacterium]|nr:SRPBCC family protein [Bacteroidales bacterium]